MGIVFEPGCVIGRGNLDADMRVALATNMDAARKKSRRKRCVSLDVRLSSEIVGEHAFDIKDGDRVSLVLEDDGSWIINNLGPDGEGYVVRSSTAKYNVGGVQFRIAATYQQAVALFGTERGIAYTFVGADSNKAFFTPVVSRTTFRPARNGVAAG